MSYIDNSFVPNDFDEDNGSTIFIVVSLIISTMIIAHSHYLHGFDYKMVQRYTELSAFVCICSNIGLIVCFRGQCSRTEYVYVVNLFVHVFCGTIVQFTDNYLVYTRYLIICHGKKQHVDYFALKAALFIAVLYGSWVPFFSFVPLFADINDPTNLFIFQMFGLWLYFIPYLLFDIFCTASTIIYWREIVRNVKPLRETVVMDTKFDVDGSEMSVSTENSVNCGNLFPLCIGPRDFLQRNMYMSVIHNVATIIFGLGADFAFRPTGIVIYFLVSALSCHLCWNWPDRSVDRVETRNYFCY